MNEVIAPRWYLKSETPAGVRYFYPLPKSRAPWSGRDAWWTDERDNPLVVRGNALVALEPILDAVEHWHQEPQTAGWTIKEPDEIHPHLLPLARTEVYPVALSTDEFNQRVAESHDSDAMLSVLNDLYDRVMTEPHEATHRYGMARLEEMPGEPDPDPSLEWHLDQPLTGGFYGPLVAHLFPGWISGDHLQSIVASAAEQRYKELGLVHIGIGNGVHSFTHNRQVSVSAVLAFDQVLPYQTVKGRSTRAREYNAERQREATYGAHWRAEITIPREVHGATKADALANLERLVEDYLGKLMPPHTVVCSNCRGRGYLR